MTDGDRIALFSSERGTDSASRKLRSDELVLAELTKILAQHPGGLRRWSVMRAIRKERESAGQDVPQNLEDEVERTFRRFCADEARSKIGGAVAKHAIFYRPAEKAGEVWAIL